MLIKIITKKDKITNGSTLQELAINNKLDSFLQSEDNVPVTLKNGINTSFDVGRDENNKIYFISHKCLPDVQSMNSERTNEGGWERCDVRKYLNKEFFPLLPDELQNIIVPTEITQMLIYPTLTKTFDKLFLLSRPQVFGKIYGCIGAQKDVEDCQIDIFSHCKESRIKGCQDFSINEWWLRTPVTSSQNEFVSVGKRGLISIGDARFHSKGIVPAFCVTK